MSLHDMDFYLKGLYKSDDHCNSMDIDTTKSEIEISSLSAAAATTHFPPAPPEFQLTQEASTSSPAEEPLITQDHLAFSPVKPTKSHKKKDSVGITTTAAPFLDADNHPPPDASSIPLPKPARRLKTIKHVVRVETRWAPKDFNELRLSSAKMYRRLAPILSCFNNEHSWMLEWQTDQMDETHDIDPVQLSKYLSIRVVPVAKEQCFYFSFRIHASGAQFTQVAKSKVLAIAKRGENLTFDPSSVPASQGELIYIGDILLKDASITHRGQYLQYLRNEVLPTDTPVFDVKL
jgi:hypothetical protein